jgi:thiamine-monophosphate kinase
VSGIELQLIRWLQSRPRVGQSVQLGIGDDMAIVSVPGGRVLLSSDLVLDGVHFDSREHTLRQIGRKALACGLSDCAAMAVRPVAAVVSVALPSNLSLEKAQDLFEGIFDLAAEFNVALAGGDTTVWDRPLAVDVLLTAVPFEGIEPVRRDGARVGDGIYVTGPLGGSILGHHLTFTPRVWEAQCLAESLGRDLHAMMDISDGLSLDLWRICQASGVGATLEENGINAIVSENARRAAERDGRTPLDHALHDGEDFELLLTASPDVVDRLWRPAETGLPLYRIGTVAESRFAWRRSDGRMEELVPKGYIH